MRDPVVVVLSRWISARATVTARSETWCSALLLSMLSSCATAPSESADTHEPPAITPAASVQHAAFSARTQPLAAVAGRYRTPHFFDFGDTSFYGADLGWTFSHGDELWVMFGDTWSSEWGTSLESDADDALGKLSLLDFPDGDAVERWVRERAWWSLPAWRAAAPPLWVERDWTGRAVPIRQVSRGVSLTSVVGLTPIAGFSNARRDATSGAFGLFLRNEPVQCDDDGSCRDGFDCDPGLGRCAPVNDLSAACVVGTADCDCVPVGNQRGLCQDRGSALYVGGSERGRSQAVVMRQQVGNAVRGFDTVFATQPWDTHRFFNATIRTVNDFDPARASGAGNDYTSADGSKVGRDGAFVWGRPSFGGLGAEGRDARLYLAWLPMPSYDEAGHFAFQPRFFAGLDAQGRPRFVEREVDSVALDLDDSQRGVQPEEMHDVVGQMSISWIPSLERWVMFYGGDMGEEFLRYIFGPDRHALAHDPLGSIYVRFAEEPWGPWTVPAPLFSAGAPDLGVIGQYGPGGILHDPGCGHPHCAPSEPAFSGWPGLPGERGRLYGPSIVDPWTEERPDGAVDLYWHLSTWNPYQVVLMRTHLTPR